MVCLKPMGVGFERSCHPSLPARTPAAWFPVNVNRAKRSIGNKEGVIIMAIHGARDGNLFLIAEALGSVGFAFCLRQGWQEHGSQDGDDRDHYQQLDQGETAGVFCAEISPSLSNFSHIKLIRSHFQTSCGLEPIVPNEHGQATRASLRPSDLAYTGLTLNLQAELSGCRVTDSSVTRRPIVTPHATGDRTSCRRRP